MDTDTHTHGGEGLMETEAETEVRHLHTKECWGLLGIARSPQKLRETRKDSSLEPLEGARPCQSLDFGLLASQTMRQ